MARQMTVLVKTQLCYSPCQECRQGTMGEHDTLGLASRSGGVDDVCQTLRKAHVHCSSVFRQVCLLNEERLGHRLVDGQTVCCLLLFDDV